MYRHLSGLSCKRKRNPPYFSFGPSLEAILCHGISNHRDHITYHTQIQRSHYGAIAWNPVDLADISSTQSHFDSLRHFHASSQRFGICTVHCEL